MRSVFIRSVLAYILIVSCKSKPISLTDQLKTNLLTHLHKIDSTLVLDSFRILRIDTANQKLFSFFDDTLYKIVLARVTVSNGQCNSKSQYRQHGHISV